MIRPYRIPVALLCLALGLTAVLAGCGQSPSQSIADTHSPDPVQSPEDGDLIHEDTPKPEATRTEDLSGYFAGYEGCFVLFDQNNNQYTVYNEGKSQIQVPPCSSFKVVHALIGLETGVLTDENTTFEWDGTRYPVESWNGDQTLASAVSNSVVWYFQRVAGEVGEEREQQYLDRIGYGNRDISGGLDGFWLQSSLEISPMEQIDILRRMYGYQLPFSREHIDIVKAVILLSDEGGVRLCGKTGSGMEGDRYVNGWFIGYVEKEGNVYFFAANIEPQEGAQAAATGVEAKAITLDILGDKGLY